MHSEIKIPSEKYISKAGKGIKVQIMKTNRRVYGTPISITSRTLNYNFKALENIIQSEFRKIKNAR